MMVTIAQNLAGKTVVELLSVSILHNQQILCGSHITSDPQK